MRKKTVLITGGGRGIGNSIAKKLASCGYSIVVADIDFDMAQQTSLALKTEFDINTLCVKMDVSDEYSVKDAKEKIESEIGTVGILINNAGITRDNLFIRMSKDDWDNVIHVNLTGCFNCIKAFKLSGILSISNHLSSEFKTIIF